MYDIYAYSHSEMGFKTRAFGRECQDANRIVRSEKPKPQRVVVSIADGVSEAQFAKEGADINVLSGSDIMLEKGMAIDRKTLASAIYKSLYQKVVFDSDRVDLKEYAATYAGIVAEGNGNFKIASVGDSLILGKTTEGDYEVLMTPMNIDNNPCLTYHNYELNSSKPPLIIRPHSEKISGKKFAAVFLFTDGAGGHFGSIKIDPETQRVEVTPINTNELDEIINQPPVKRAKLIDEMCKKIAFPDRSEEVEKLLENINNASTDEEADVYENALKSIWPHNIGVGGDDATIGCVIFDDMAREEDMHRNSSAINGSIAVTGDVSLPIKRTVIIPLRKAAEEPEAKEPEQVVEPECTVCIPRETQVKGCTNKVKFDNRFDTAEKVKQCIMKEDAPIGIRLFMAAIDN